MKGVESNASIFITVPPSVQPLPQDGKFVVRKGSTITLECEAKGNPVPKITWQRSVSTLLRQQILGVFLST